MKEIIWILQASMGEAWFEDLGVVKDFKKYMFNKKW